MEDLARKKILVVDDDESFLRSVVDGLSFSGRFGVKSARTGREALNVLGTATVDLVITDLKMPDMSGFELVAHLGQSHPNLPVIAMTAFGTPELEENLRLLGVVDCIEKPLDLDTLLNKIEVTLTDGPVSAPRFISQSSRNILTVFFEATLTGQFSGEVIARSGDKSGRVFVYRGSVAWIVASTVRKTLIDEIAVSAGVGRDEMRTVFDECRKSGKNFGETLVAWQLITMDRLRQILLDHIARAFLEILTWSNVEVMFVQEDRAYSGSLTFPLSELLPRAKELDEQQKLPPLDLDEISTRSKAVCSAVLDDLSVFKQIDGFIGVGAFLPTGAALAEVTTDHRSLSALAYLTNDIIADAQKMTCRLGLGCASMAEIRTENTSALISCYNENAQDATVTKPGNAHIHFLLVVESHANIPLARLRFEKVVQKIAPSLRTQ